MWIYTKNSKIIFISVAIISLLTANFAFSNGEKTIEEVIDNTLKTLSGQKLDQGRINLHKEMAKAKGQLDKDLPRSKIVVGNTNYPLTPRPKTPLGQFQIFGDILRGYIKKFATDITFNDGRIGPFYPSEVLFPIVQQTTAQSEIMAFKDNPKIFQNWGPDKNLTDFFVKYTVYKENKNNILELDYQVSKGLLYIGGDPKIKDLKTTKAYFTNSKVLFNLNTGEVRYKYSYNIPGTPDISEAKKSIGPMMDYPVK